MKSLLLIVTISLSLLAQSPVPSESTAPKTSEKFITMEGGFSVDRPARKDDRTDFNSLYFLKVDDGRFTWQNGKSNISVDCFNETFRPEDAQEIVKNYIDNALVRLPANKLNSISESAFKFRGDPAIELKLEEQGISIQSRTILAHNKLCTLRAAWPTGDDGAEQIKVLDSFQFVDNTEFNKRRLDAATPKPLPRSPTIKRSETDVGLDGLKGKVKTVTKLKSAAELPLAKQITFEDSYDRNGNRLKHVAFDYRANPWSIEIYGFMEGKLVSNVGTIVHGYDALGSAPSGYVKPPDPPYRFSYEFKYDDKRRLVEKLVFWHTGKLEQKTIYTYDSNKLDETTIDRSGKEIAKSIKYYDPKGNLIEVDYLSLSQRNDDDIQKFTYEKFDTRGNWTERRVSENRLLRNGNRGDIQRIEYRVITYF